MIKGKNFLSGFTIIELIVVVAIIAILAIIVFSNITGYTVKGSNSSIKESISSLVINGVSYYYANGSFSDFNEDSATGCGPGGRISSAVSSAGGSLLCKVSVDGSAWCGCSRLNTTNDAPTGSVFCVDSKGAKVVKINSCADECTSDGVCQ